MSSKRPLAELEDTSSSEEEGERGANVGKRMARRRPVLAPSHAIRRKMPSRRSKTHASEGIRRELGMSPLEKCEADLKDVFGVSFAKMEKVVKKSMGRPLPEKTPTNAVYREQEGIIQSISVLEAPNEWKLSHVNVNGPSAGGFLVSMRQSLMEDLDAFCRDQPPTTKMLSLLPAVVSVLLNESQHNMNPQTRLDLLNACGEWLLPRVRTIKVVRRPMHDHSHWFQLSSNGVELDGETYFDCVKSQKEDFSKGILQPILIRNSLFNALNSYVDKRPLSLKELKTSKLPQCLLELVRHPSETKWLREQIIALLMSWRNVIVRENGITMEQFIQNAIL